MEGAHRSLIRSLVQPNSRTERSVSECLTTDAEGVRTDGTLICEKSQIDCMDKPIKGYGAIGLVFWGIVMLGAALIVEPLAAQGLLALFGLGVLIRGVRVYRKSVAGS